MKKKKKKSSHYLVWRNTKQLQLQPPQLPPQSPQKYKGEFGTTKMQVSSSDYVDSFKWRLLAVGRKVSNGAS